MDLFPILGAIMYIIPQDLLRQFQAVSANNFSVNGRHVETLAYLFGHEVDGYLVGTHLVFPQQDGTCSRVDDKGNILINKREKFVVIQITALPFYFWQCSLYP